MKFPYFLRQKPTQQAEQSLPTADNPPRESSTLAVSVKEDEDADAVSQTPSSKSRASHIPNNQEEKVIEKTAVEEAAALDKPDDEEADYPSGVKLGIIVASLCVSVFLMALDNTIIATGKPNYVQIIVPWKYSTRRSHGPSRLKNRRML